MPRSPGQELEITTESDAAEHTKQLLELVPAKVVVKSMTDYTKYMGDLALVKRRRKMIEDWFDSLKRPIRESLNALQDKMNGMLEPVKEREKALAAACGQFFMLEEAKARAKQDEINRKHTDKVEAAIRAGKDPDVIAPPRQAVAPAQSTGGITIRMIKKWAIDDEKIIPDQYWQLDQALIGQHVRAGVEIPGIRAYDAPSAAGR